MRWIQIAAAVFAAIFTIILISGFLTDPVLKTEAEVNIGAPKAVVLNTLLNLQSYSSWNKTVAYLKPEIEADSLIKISYSIAGKHFRYPQNTIYKSNKGLCFVASGDFFNALSENFIYCINVDGLPDGTVSVHASIQTTVKPVLSRFFAYLFYTSGFNASLKSDLNNLKKYIE